MSEKRTGHGRATALLAAAALAAVAAACSGTPSANVSTSSGKGAVPTRQEAYKKAGKVTLLVVDQETSASGMKEFGQLNKAFEQKYPNITVKRVTRDFTSLVANETLLLSGSNVPDVVETDESYATQGRLVKAGLLTNLNGYGRSWGWLGRQSQSLLLCCRLSSTGKGLGSGNLYGIPASSQIVGIYYNAKLLHQLGLQPPQTRQEFEAALAKAKAAGITPIVAGNAQSSDLITWGFQIAWDMNADAKAQQDALLGRRGASFTTPEALAAAKEVATWGQKGYFSPGYGGISPDQATAAFEKNQGLFYINGSWWGGDLAGSMGKNVRFMVPPAPSPGATRSGIYAAGQPWAIPSKAAHPLAAALYIDFITDPANRHVFVDAGDIPAGPVSTAGLALAPVLKDFYTAAAYLGAHNSALPFFWAIPTGQQFWQHQGQGLTDGHLSPQDFVNGVNQGMQADSKQNAS